MGKTTVNRDKRGKDLIVIMNVRLYKISQVFQQCKFCPISGKVAIHVHDLFLVRIIQFI